MCCAHYIHITRPTSSQTQEELCLAVSHVKVTGPPQYTSTTGLTLFEPPASSQAPPLAASQQQLAQPRPSQQATEAAAAAAAVADVFLAVHLQGLPGQGFPVRLRPGAPAALELLAGGLPAGVGVSLPACQSVLV